MIYFIIFVLLIWVWLIAEWINAPSYDEHTNKKNNDSTVKPNDTHNKDI